MAYADRRIELLARAIANRLEDRGLVEFGDAETAIAIVAKAIEENLVLVEAIEQEARRRLAAAGAPDPGPEAVQDEMRRLSAERGITL
jgi:hypothetical protein